MQVVTIGAPIEDLDTPVLLLDLDAAQRNIARMADFFTDKPCKLRPHFKNHKCTSLMQRQLEREAVGVACAKLGEAEVLVAAGIENVLIANQVVGEAKIERLLGLLDRATVRVAVDSEDNCRALSQAAAAGGHTLGCLVEIDIGMKRCGVAPGEEALALALLVESLPGLRFDGIQAYEGHTVLGSDPQQRIVATQASHEKTRVTKELIQSAGLPVPIVSGGGTGTYDVTGVMPWMDEVQAGTYVTMDWYYQTVRPEFEVALSILVTCISTAVPGRAVFDVGVKGVGAEFGPPIFRDRPDIRIATFRSEEHCIGAVEGSAPRVGDKLHLIPSHACTTCNLYRDLVVYQEGRVVDVWPIEGSGRLR